VGHRTGVSGGTDDGVELTGWPGSPHEATRYIHGHLPECDPVEDFPRQAERPVHGEDAPVLLPPDVIEGEFFQAIQVADPRTTRGTSGFAGFLDGTQDIRVVNQSHGIPIVWATVSAAIRARVNRRLIAWSGHPPIVSRRYYIPFRYVDGLRSGFRAHPLVIDTAREDSSGNIPSRHPAALMEAAVQRVQQDRESIELALAESWCANESATLFVDGSITGSKVVSESTRAVGVVKSHRRLYADGNAFRTLVGLRAGERSSIFRVTPRSRYAVASWYVRMRSAAGRDALFGLVRVEAAITGDLKARADEISRWIIAEGSPLALPDGRWDKMAYGIRDTEEFLRAIS
jgi:hypothetical protein